ncbi:cytokine receptor [Eurosta solidaginis]|uniref:cytokine receptor n=1 Tax=Eurosta solidaginis TaxID=178769 RepID=UPI003530CE78
MSGGVALGYVRKATAALMLLLFTAHTVADFPDDVGETIPSHVEISVGDSKNISCFINPNLLKENLCKMYFVNKTDNYRPVPAADIVEINSTYIIYMLRNALQQSATFTCKCGHFAIMESDVDVGTAPNGVTKFDCRSYDFEYMVCNFTKPNNPLLTQYNLTYYINSPDYETPVSCNFDNTTWVVCNITADQSYRPLIEEYRFKVHSSNALGYFKQEFIINNLNVMIPARPGNHFQIHRLTTDTLEAVWNMPKYDWYSPNKHRGLLWEVLIQPVGFPVRDISAQVRVVHVERGCKLIVNDLPYAYYWYDLHIRVKVRTAVASDDMWSSTFKYRFRTRPRIPDRPPRTDNGSFYINSLKTEVRLYWEQLEKWEENGDNFAYIIRAITKDSKGNTSRLLPRQQKASFAVFEWSEDSLYLFNISSCNHIGESFSSSSIIIYPQTRSSKEYTPISIHNAYHQTNRSYTLTWISPPRRKDLQNYTVYWCDSKLAMPTECGGSIHFRHVSPNIQRFATEPRMTEHEHSLTLAVSANYRDYNTGMHWTSCSVDVNADFEPMEPEIHQSISSTDLRVQWSSKTICPIILNGYNLTYCEVANSPATDSVTPPSIGSSLFESFIAVSPEEAPCKGPSTTITIDKNLNECNITGLKPYTLYRLEMFMFSNVKVGKPSQSQLGRTSEAAPTPPRQLNVSELTDKSAIIRWLPPSQKNGYIRRYIVKLNNKEYIVNASAFIDDGEITFVLQNLTSFTPYKAFVIAVTSDNSGPSNDIHFTTHMSAPSKVSNFESHNKNKMEVELKWAPPTVPGGRLDYYEVAVTQLHGDYEEHRRISVVFGLSCLLRVPTCPDRDYQTKVEVRAINAALIANNEVNPINLEAQQTRNKFDHDVGNYNGNDDLVCADATDLAIREKHATQFARYQNTSVYLLYKSDWYPFTTFGCAERQLGKITAITLMVACTTVLLMALMFFATKKWKMMSDIQCTLPAALDAYLTKELNSGAGGGGGMALGNGDVGGIFVNDFHALSISRNAHLPTLDGSNEGIHNEERHLLGTLKNDSGYIGDGILFGRSISAVATSVSTENDGSEEDLVYGRREYLNSESSADSLIGSTNSSGGSGEVEVAQDVVINALPLKRIIEEPSGYVQLPHSKAAGHSAYVTTDNWSAWAQEKSAVSEAPTIIEGSAIKAAASVDNEAIGKDGYIQAATVALGRQTAEKNTCLAPKGNATSLSGYIKSCELSKLMQPRDALSAVTKEIDPACHSGYIKPADLLATPQNVPIQQADEKLDTAPKNGYIEASDLYAYNVTWPQLQHQKSQQQHPITAALSNSSYVTVDSLTAMASEPVNTAEKTPPLTTMLVNADFNSPHDIAPTTMAPASAILNQPSSGYVQPSTLQQLLLSTPATEGGVKSINSPTNNTNFSGYTTLDALSKFTSSIGRANSLRSQLSAEQSSGGKAGLVGYVTQREMNEFGQQQNQQQ